MRLNWLKRRRKSEAGRAIDVRDRRRFLGHGGLALVAEREANENGDVCCPVCKTMGKNSRHRLEAADDRAGRSLHRTE
jgi:hypothetical protein